jgi:hypothetical protein
MRLLPAAAALALVVGLGTIVAPDARAAGAPGLAATAPPVVDRATSEQVHYRRYRGYRRHYYGPGFYFSFGYPYAYRRHYYRPYYYRSYRHYRPYYGHRRYYRRHYHRHW